MRKLRELHRKALEAVERTSEDERKLIKDSSKHGVVVPLLLVLRDSPGGMKIYLGHQGKA